MHTAGDIFKLSFLPGKNCNLEQTCFRGLWFCLWNIGEPDSPTDLCENPDKKKIKKLFHLTLHASCFYNS